MLSFATSSLRPDSIREDLHFGEPALIANDSEFIAMLIRVACSQSGTPTNPGIIPQAVSDIFKYIRAVSLRTPSTYLRSSFAHLPHSIPTKSSFCAHRIWRSTMSNSRTFSRQKPPVRSKYGKTNGNDFLFHLCGKKSLRPRLT